MTWAYIKSTGRGAIALRLKVAGSPIEWVTDNAQAQLNPSSGVLARCVGLDRKSCTFAEDVDIPRARMKLTGFEARIKDIALPGFVIGGEGPLLSGTLPFGRVPQGVTWLASSVTDAVTSIPVQSTTLFDGSGVFWLDSEAITYSSTDATHFLGCTRGALGTSATYHYVPDGVSALTDRPEVTDWPRVFEGRRCWLYAYGDGDDLTGAGSQVFAGVVRREARLASDGSTWSMQIDPITTLWAQSAGADLKGTFGPRGIYFPWDSCFYISLRQSSDATAANLPTTYLEGKVTGFFEDNATLAAAINTKMDSMVAGRYGVTCIGTPDGLRFELRTSSPAKFVGMHAWSRVDQLHGNLPLGNALLVTYPLLGYTDGLAVAGTVGPSASVAINTTYIFPSGAVPDITGSVRSSAVIAPGIAPRGGCSQGTASHGRRDTDPVFAEIHDETAAASAPSNRIYLGRGVNVSSLTAIVAKWDNAEGSGADYLTVTGSNASSNYADVSGITAPRDFAGGGDFPQFQGLRLYVTAGNLRDLYDYMERQLVKANVENRLPLLEEVAALLGEIRSAWAAVPLATR